MDAGGTYNNNYNYIYYNIYNYKISIQTIPLFGGCLMGRWDVGTWDVPLSKISPNYLELSEILLIFAPVNIIITLMSKETITKLIADYFKTQPVLKAWLFGSFSRGEETDTSDIDILIVLDDNQHVGLKFFGMYEDLKELLGRNVDLVTDRSLAPFARESVDRDKILIYERAA